LTNYKLQATIYECYIETRISTLVSSLWVRLQDHQTQSRLILSGRLPPYLTNRLECKFLSITKHTSLSCQVVNNARKRFLSLDTVFSAYLVEKLACSLEYDYYLFLTERASLFSGLELDNQFRKTLKSWTKPIKKNFFKIKKNSNFERNETSYPRNSYSRERPSTIGLLIKVAYFVKRGMYIFSTKPSWSELVNTRKSIVLNRHSP